jgi:hypothetical protein
MSLSGLRGMKERARAVSGALVRMVVWMRGVKWDVRRAWPPRRSWRARSTARRRERRERGVMLREAGSLLEEEEEEAEDGIMAE